MPLEVPFGRYALLQRIAAGGMAELFLARQKGLEGFEKLCAIKRILPSKSDDPRFVALFLEEARLAARLSHPNIAQIYDLGIEGGSYYLAMEFVSGENLGTLQRRALQLGKAMPLPLALKIASDVCEGLYYAHEMKDPLGRAMRVVHCDISPQNILVSYDGTVKLVDFGIARAMAPGSGGAEALELRGKASYMAPEQITGDPLDGTTDLFALGIVLYELIASRRLFARADDEAVMRAVLEDPIPPLRHFAPGASPRLERAVERALSRRRSDRYTDARALQKDLVEALADQGGLPTAAALQAFMGELFGESLRARTVVDQTRTAVLPYSVSEAKQALPEVGTVVDGMARERPSSAPGLTRAGRPLPMEPTASLRPGQGRLGAQAARELMAVVEAARVIEVADLPATPVRVRRMPRRVVVLSIGAGVALAGIAALAVVLRGAEQTPSTPRLPGPEVVELLPSQRTPPPEPVPEPTPVEPTGEPAETDPPAPRRAERRARAASLSVATQPWTRVAVDGRSLGPTPLRDARVPSGKRTLTLSNPELGLHVTTRVVLPADRKTSLRIHLERRAGRWAVARQVKL